MGLKLLLHVGCGSKVNKPPFEFAAYKDVRLDCNKIVQPDIVASIVAMPMISDGEYDAIFASHILEHLHPHEIGLALAEFARVLKPGGRVLIQVPDLQSIGGRLALDQADYILYHSHIGVITPLDMLYGHRGSVGAGNLYMAHKSGFTQSVLKDALHAAGFDKVEIDRETQYELKARACKPLEVVNEQEEESSASCREDPGCGAESGGAGNGRGEVPERTLREAGVPMSAGG